MYERSRSETRKLKKLAALLYQMVANIESGGDIENNENKPTVDDMTTVVNETTTNKRSSPEADVATTDADAPAPKKARKFWSEDENDRLKAAVELHGVTQFEKVAEMVGTRDAKQCRGRWKHLSTVAVTTTTTTTTDDNTAAAVAVAGGEEQQS
jgi:hypothetical protein